MELPMDALGSLAKPLQQDMTGPTSRPVPDETATHMPAQDLERWDASSRAWHDQDRAAIRQWADRVSGAVGWPWRQWHHSAFPAATGVAAHDAHGPAHADLQ